MSSDQLQFIDYRKPKLEAGDYVFDVTHKYGEPGGTSLVKPSGSIKVRVGCERVSISPDLIYGQFPPPGQSGDYADTLPHISVKKGALPWSRSAWSEQNDEPWLFLLVFNQSDVDALRAKKPQAKTLDTLDDGDVFFPPAQLQNLKDDTTLGEQGQNIKTVDVKNSLFKKILANNKAQIKQLTHVRRRWQPESILVQTPDQTVLGYFDSVDITTLTQNKVLPDTTHVITVLTQGKSWLITDQICGEYLVELDENNALWQFSLKRELGVMLSNRLGYVSPEDQDKGTRNYACLVSLEHYFDDEVALTDLADDKYLRLIVLYDWWFNCTTSKMNFGQVSANINADSLRLPQQTISSGAGFQDRLQAGLTGLPHKFRLGDRSVSWYRGPFAPCAVGEIDQILLSDEQLGKADDTYSATDADKLLRYFAKDGMFDVSYAAAYELGRFLSMNHVNYTKNLAAYKRGRARYVQLAEDDKTRQQHAGEQGISIKHLPYAKLDENLVAGEREQVKQWLLSLASFEEVPSWYLIPDNKLLPGETIRTFKIDPMWVQSLWLGALSLSGRPKISNELFTELHQELSQQLPCYGVLLRSELLWAYPSLQVEARKVGDDHALDLAALKAQKGDDYTDYIESFPVHSWLNKRSFTADTTAFLCREPLNYVSLSLPAESLHYGITIETVDDQTRYRKTLKTSTGTAVTANIPFVDNDSQDGIIDINTLAQNIKAALAGSGDFNSARIGRYLLEGEAKAEFTLGETV